MEKIDVSKQSCEKEALEIHYDLRYNEVKDGLKQFYKKRRFKRNIIYTILCGAIFLINLIDVLVRKNTQPMIFLFLILCMAILVFIWYFPVQHREKMARIIEENPMNFSIKINEDSILVEKENGEEVINLLDPKLEILEDEEKFIILPPNEEIYILPKRCIEDAKEVEKRFEIMGSRFQQKLGGKNG